MPDFTFTAQLFPDGTSVSAYDATGYSNFPAGGPPGGALATAEVKSGSVTLSGLTDKRSYFAAAKVGGVWRSVRFIVGMDATSVPVETEDLKSGILYAPQRDETLDLAQTGVGTTVEASEITFPLNVTRAAAVDDVITSKVTGDTQPRYVQNTDGALEWGSGASALDTVLYRLSADILKTDDTFWVKGNFVMSANLEHAGSKVGFYGLSPVSRPTALTASDATAIDATYGEVEQKVIENTRTRVNELDTKLKALGLLT